MQEKLFEQIADFVERHQGVSRAGVHMDSKIEQDLGITGDDALDMIVAFGKNFNVAVSGFMAADYFNAEGASRFFCTWEPTKPLTVGDLVKAAIAGRLDEQTINDHIAAELYLGRGSR